mgnify:CR=1 FL=1
MLTPERTCDLGAVSTCDVIARWSIFLCQVNVKCKRMLNLRVIKSLKTNGYLRILGFNLVVFFIVVLVLFLSLFFSLVSFVYHLKLLQTLRVIMQTEALLIFLLKLNLL